MLSRPAFSPRLINLAVLMMLVAAVLAVNGIVSNIGFTSESNCMLHADGN